MTAAELLAYSSILKGYYALAFPEFGAERRGAPVTAYNRVSERPISDRSPVLEPDCVVILDPTMVKRETLRGLKRGGFVVANTARKPGELSELLGHEYRYATVDATRIALDTLKLPIVNTAMSAALVSATKIVDLEHLIEALRARFSARVAELNERAVRRAYESTEVA